MRLFIAILFDREFTEALGDYQNRLRAQGVRGRFTPRENLHLTLAFIGEYHSPDKALEAMKAADFAAVALRPEKAGFFGDLLWAGVSGDPALAEYAKRLRRELAKRQIPCDKKRFFPHVTLVRRAERSRDFAFPPLPAAGMRACRVSLMKSEQGKNGMLYTELGSIAPTASV